MFCPTCGKEINDEVQFCPGCGAKISATVTQNTPSQYNGYAQRYGDPSIMQQIKEYVNEVNTIHLLAILSLFVLGPILAIIATVKKNNLPVIHSFPDQNAQYEYENAQRKLHTAETCIKVTWILFCVGMFGGIIWGVVAGIGMASYYF